MSPNLWRYIVLESQTVKIVVGIPARPTDENPMTVFATRSDRSLNSWLSAILVLLVTGFNAQTPTKPQQSPVSNTGQTQSSGHQAMLAMLNEIHASGLQADPFLGTQQLDAARVRMAELGLAKNAAHRQRVDAVIQVANHELRLGLIEQAIEHYSEAR